MPTPALAERGPAHRLLGALCLRATRPRHGLGTVRGAFYVRVRAPLPRPSPRPMRRRFDRDLTDVL